MQKRRMRTASSEETKKEANFCKSALQVRWQSRMGKFQTVQSKKQHWEGIL
jgi:hypothetical protein